MYTLFSSIERDDRVLFAQKAGDERVEGPLFKCDSERIA